MNGSARAHLLARLEAATAPWFIAKLAPSRPRTPDLDAALEQLTGLRTGLVLLPPDIDIGIRYPERPLVRVVAGKGARRRGIRGRRPLIRIVRMVARR